MHEKTLWIVYIYYDCAYKDSLKMDRSFTVHQRSIQSLAIESVKAKQNISTNMINNIFQMRDNVRYNLRSQFEFLGSSDSTSQFQIGRNSLRVFNAKVWNMVPTKIKNSTTLNNLKEKIRKREPINFNRKFICYWFRILDIQMKCYLNSISAVLKNQPQ